MILHALALLALALAAIPALTAIANLLLLAATRRPSPAPGRSSRSSFRRETRKATSRARSMRRS